jgi:RecB family exonuclease
MNATQRAVLALLGAAPGDRPVFPAGLRDELRSELETAVEPLVGSYTTLQKSLYVNKRVLSLVHGCEAHYVADRATPFEWSTGSATGTVAHKAVELLVGWRGDPNAGDLVGGALERLETGDDTLGPWLAGLAPPERAELTAATETLVAGFLEGFPPLERRWRPVVESRVRLDLAGGRVGVVGRVDLSIGCSDGEQAGKILIDLKTGRPQAIHTEDLRLYALLEALRFGTPPRLLVSFYLDSGEPHTETVTENVLWVAAQRLVDGIERIAQLDAGREPERRPGPCRWCPARHDCEPGLVFIAGTTGDGL